MELVKYGNTFDECLEQAISYSDNNEGTFIHPYNDLDIIEGQNAHFII